MRGCCAHGGRAVCTDTYKELEASVAPEGLLPKAWRMGLGGAVGLAAYAMDSHFCQRVVVEEKGHRTVRNEGGFGLSCPKPYPVSYRSIVPKKGECNNLLVPVCLSSSHVAYGSIRMEPVFMILGQSAGMAACLAIDDNVSVQDVEYDKLKKQLIAAKQRL